MTVSDLWDLDQCRLQKGLSWSQGIEESLEKGRLRAKRFDSCI